MALDSSEICLLEEKIDEYLSYDRNESTRMNVEHLLKQRDYKTLRDMMMYPLVFGTAGIRAKMGPGFSYLNDVTIIQTTQGLVKYFEECPETKDYKNKGIVIGFDGRYHSDRWAKMCANIFLNSGIKVYLFSKLCPTPFVPFALKFYSCIAGIMITASHNPREYNGFKLYWTNGVQLISPHDKYIAENITKYKEPWETSWNDIKIHENDSLLLDPLMEITNNYMKFISEKLLYKEINEKADLQIVFTPLHGVGWVYIQRAFQLGGFESVFPVIQQQDPDPNFPTLVYPNPEEGRFVMKLAMDTAFKHNCSLVLATDPDADRMSVVEKKMDEDDWHFFNGNEQGILLAWWAFRCWLIHNSTTNTDNKMPVMEEDIPVTDAAFKSKIKNIYMVASTVSSHLIERMAQMEGFNYAETLTGFKWIGNKADELIKSGHEVIFAFEEAIGYMCDPRILDKDGISACLIMAEMASFLKVTRNITLYQKLQEIYLKYGYNVCRNSYLNCYDPNVIVKIFDEMRNWEGHGKYPTHCGSYQIKYVRDLTVGYDNSKPDNKPVLPFSKSNQMITFTFAEHGIRVTLRASGTEPKIKYYSELQAPAGIFDKPALKNEIKLVIAEVVNDLLKPGVNNISYPSLIPESEMITS